MAAAVVLVVMVLVVLTVVWVWAGAAHAWGAVVVSDSARAHDGRCGSAAGAGVVVRTGMADAPPCNVVGDHWVKVPPLLDHLVTVNSYQRAAKPGPRFSSRSYVGLLVPVPVAVLIQDHLHITYLLAHTLLQPAPPPRCYHHHWPQGYDADVIAPATSAHTL